MSTNKLSHQEWRRVARKFQRKRRRRLAAQHKAEGLLSGGLDHRIPSARTNLNSLCIPIELMRRQQSPSYQAESVDEDALERSILDAVAHFNEIENAKWVESELRIEEKWHAQQLKQEEHDRKRDAERKRIQDEFMAKQKRVTEAIEAKKRRVEEEQRLHTDLQQRIQQFINCDGPIPAELLTKAETNPSKEICPFFARAATCRFGNRCARNHIRPAISRILLITSFFASINLGLNQTTEYGNDSTLECDENELLAEFREFFRDVLLEFQRFGCIEYFVVCQNYAPHHRGNVYIEYATEREAMRAQQAMNSRYYAGRQINIEFCRISWKEAVCGLSLKRQCSKGQNCNNLHIFDNPLGQYALHVQLWKQRHTGTKEIGQATNVPNDTNGWDNDDETSRRNWRWSESPPRRPASSKEIKVRASEKEHKKRTSRSRSRLDQKHSNDSRATDPSQNRVTRSRSNNRERSRDRSRSSKRRQRSPRQRSSHTDGTQKKHKKIKKEKGKKRDKDKKKAKSEKKMKKRVKEK